MGNTTVPVRRDDAFCEMGTLAAVAAPAQRGARTRGTEHTYSAVPNSRSQTGVIDAKLPPRQLVWWVSCLRAR